MCWVGINLNAGDPILNRPIAIQQVITIKKGQSVHTFAQRVYALVKKVPPGRVTTYQEIAHALDSRAYRAVGQALRKNPYAPQVPCHRVVSTSGHIGGFRGHNSGNEIQKKIALLTAEGIEVRSDKITNFRALLFCFS